MNLKKQKTITRDALSKAIRRESGITLKRSGALVDQVLNSITENLKLGHNVAIRRFGVFTLRHKKARMGRNPKTMEPAVISSRTVVTLKSSSVLKQRISDTRKYVRSS